MQCSFAGCLLVTFTVVMFQIVHGLNFCGIVDLNISFSDYTMNIPRYSLIRLGFIEKEWRLDEPRHDPRGSKSNSFDFVYRKMEIM